MSSRHTSKKHIKSSWCRIVQQALLWRTCLNVLTKLCSMYKVFQKSQLEKKNDQLHSGGNCTACACLKYSILQQREQNGGIYFCLKTMWGNHVYIDQKINSLTSRKKWWESERHHVSGCAHTEEQFTEQAARILLNCLRQPTSTRYRDG